MKNKEKWIRRIFTTAIIITITGSFLAAGKKSEGRIRDNYDYAGNGLLENRSQDDTIKGASSEETKAAVTAQKAGNEKKKPAVELVTGREQYFTDVKKITLVYKNNTDNTYMYGEEVILEKKKKGKWVSVKTVPDVGWHDIGILLLPEKTAKQKIDMGLFFSGLDKGSYRLVKTLYPETGSKTPIVLYAKFKLKERAAFKMELEKSVYPLGTEYIRGTIYNTSGKNASIVLIPHLEKKQGSRWKEIKCMGGFCGVGDLLERSMEIEVNLKDWYPNLKPGKYRLSYTVSYGRDLKDSIVIGDTFQLKG